MSNQIPSRPRFNYAEEKARQVLLYCNVSTMPVDVRSLIKSSNKCIIKRYSKLIERYSFSKQDLVDEFGDDGAILYDARKVKPYTIVYNDVDKPSTRITWTLAHELGHLVLKHHIDFDETKLSRGGLTDDEYKVLDVEADAFAAELLAPIMVAISANWDSKVALMQHCGLSAVAARNRSRSIRKVINFKECYFKYEREIYSSFFNHIYMKYCVECKTFFVSREAIYCPICGSHNIIWKEGEENIMRYSGILVDENSKALTCPKCENEEIFADGDHCMICGFNLINKCVGEAQYDQFGGLEGFTGGCGKLLPGNARYCPYCGGQSSFFADGVLTNWELEKQHQDTTTVFPF